MATVGVELVTNNTDSAAAANIYIAGGVFDGSETTWFDAKACIHHQIRSVLLFYLSGCMPKTHMKSAKTA